MLSREKMKQAEEKRLMQLEEKILKERLNIKNLIGQRLYFSMNNGKTYRGTLIKQDIETGLGYMIMLADVLVMEDDTSMEYACLYYESMSSWWTEESQKGILKKNYEEEKKERKNKTKKSTTWMKKI